MANTSSVGAGIKKRQKVNVRNQILKAFKKRSVILVRALINDFPAEEIVEILERLSIAELVFFIRSLRSEDAAIWFNYLSLKKQEQIIEHLSDPEVQKIISELESDDLVDLLEELPSEVMKKLIGLSSQSTRKAVNTLLSFNDNEAGSIMNVEFFELKSFWTVQQSLDYIREVHDRYEEFNVYYISNEENKLVGKTNLNELTFTPDYTQTLEKIMRTDITICMAKDSVSEIRRIFEKYNKEAVPIVDSNNCLIGIISDNDIMDLIIEESAEDFNKMYGIGEMRYSYLQASIWSIFRSRIFWLTILMISSTLSSIVIDLFSNWGATLTAGISTALLIPIMTVISGASGNAGSQASVSVIRALSLGELIPRKYGAVVWKEVRVGFLLGITLMVLNFGRLLLYYLAFPPQSSLNYQADPGWQDKLGDLAPYTLGVIVSATSSLCLMIAIVLAKLVGSFLPLLAYKIKIDPAAMVAPLLTTLLDAASVAIFFAIGIGIISVVIV